MKIRTVQHLLGIWGVRMAMIWLAAGWLAILSPNPVLAGPSAPTPGQVTAWVAAGTLDPLTNGTLTFLQITDVHLTNPYSPGNGSVDLLNAGLGALSSNYPSSAFLVDTGDTHYGWNQAVWNAALSNVPFASYLLLGNSDVSATLTLVEGLPPAPGLPDRTYKLDLGPALFFLLDSTLPGGHEGVLRNDQLLWIHQELAQTSNRFVFIAFHHTFNYLANQDAFQSLLEAHAPRQRLLFLISGHTHTAAYYDRGTFQELVADSLQLGRYSVFHLGDDWLAAYERDFEVPEGYVLPGNIKPIVTRVLTNLPDRSQAPPLDPVRAATLEEEFAWPGRSNWTTGTVMNLDFSDPPDVVVHDHSGMKNEAYSDFLFWMKKGGRPLTPWVTNAGRRAINFGHPRVAPSGMKTFKLTVFDALSLNSPAATKQLALSVDTLVSGSSLGREYVLVGKKAYELVLDATARPQLRVWVKEAAGRRQLVVTAPDALSNDVWHTVHGTFDGRVARLYVDGAPVGEAQSTALSVLAAKGPLAVGDRATSVEPGDPAPLVLIGRVQVANQALPPPRRSGPFVVGY